MSVLSAPRVDASSPVLSALVTASKKSLTGSVSFSSLGHEVVVFCESGQIVAVHSPSFVPPVATYLRVRTGVDFTGRANPFEDAYGQNLVNAEVIDAASRDWAYGLLASALTWEKPHVTTTKRVKVGSNTIMDSTWGRVSADLNARVAELVSSWATISEFLLAQGFEPRNASHACARLSVEVPGHPLFTGQFPLDDVAQRAGLTRYVVLRDLARVLLSSPPEISFSIVSPEASAGAKVPEALENPAREWASVEAIGYDPALHAPEPAPAPAHDTLEPVVAALEVEEPEVEPDDDVDVAEDVEDDLESLSPPEQYASHPFSDVEVPAPAPVEVIEQPAAPAVFGGHDAQYLADWVSSSTSPNEHAIRQGIVDRTVASSVEQTIAHLDALEAAAQELAAACERRDALHADLTSAQGDLQAANEQVEAARAELSRVEAWAQSIFDAESAAEEQARESAAAASDAQRSLDEARAAVQERERELQESAARAEHDEQAAEELRVRARGEVQESLAAAHGVVDTVERTVVAPASARVAQVSAAAGAASESAEDANRHVYETGTTAELSVDVTDALSALASGEQDAAAPLKARLDGLRDRVVSVISGEPRHGVDPLAIAVTAELEALEPVGHQDELYDDVQDDGPPSTSAELDELDDLDGLEDEDSADDALPAPMPAPMGDFDLQAILSTMEDQDEPASPSTPDFDALVSGDSLQETAGVDPHSVQWAPISTRDDQDDDQG